MDYHYFSWILESVSKTLASYFYQSVFLSEHMEIVFQILSFFFQISFYTKPFILKPGLVHLSEYLIDD